MLINKINATLNKLCRRNVSPARESLQHVKISGNNFAYDTYEQITTAQDILENYAKSKNITINIYDPKIDFPTKQKSGVEYKIAKTIGIQISDLTTKKTVQDYIKAFDSSSFLTRTKENQIPINIPGEYTQKLVETKSTFQDNFLRYLYYNIEHMVKQLKKQ